MDNKVGYVIIALLITTIVVVAFCSIYLHNEIADFGLEATSTTQHNLAPSTTPVNQSPSPSPTPLNQPPSNPPFSQVTYYWYLKPELRGNTTWLENVLHGEYNYGKSWSDNYVVFIESIWEVPQSVKDIHMTGLVGASFIMHLPSSATYDAQTGHTSVTYEYADHTYYVIESVLPNIAIDGKWTQNCA